MHISANANVNADLLTGDEIDIPHFSRPAETRMMHANSVHPRVGGLLGHHHHDRAEQKW
jgi:hypothetical protein